VEAIEGSQGSIAKLKEGKGSESPVIFVDIVSLMNDVGMVTDLEGI